MTGRQMWDRYCRYRFSAPELGLALDVSRVRFEDDDFERARPSVSSAMDAMEALEAGAVANPDEGRMVGHYWLRAPDLAPSNDVAEAIRLAIESVRDLAGRVRRGTVRGADGPFEHVVHVGIGGSALGPQLVCEALGPPEGLPVSFLDNADPDGVDRLLARLGPALGRTLVSVVSKTGVTPTPRHVTAELLAAYRARGLDFARHAVATTMPGSPLAVQATRERWLAQLPIWEWVGGRTSVTSAVGLLPLALAGVDPGPFLAGAAAMDRLTRERDPRANPAALLALAWYWLGDGVGAKRMVVLPYRDRLALFPRYVQQLVMESVGKERDRAGRVVHQGLTVYGNKGSTDQHAYAQQLRDGTADFFVTFVAVRGDRRDPSGDGRDPSDRGPDEVEVEPGLTLGDHLFGYLEGTRDALYERGRESITISLRDAGPASIGALIALYERAVGIYAEMIDVNAYHQPGVDKKAAAGVVELQNVVVAHLRTLGEPRTAEQIADGVGRPDRVETVFRLLERLAEDPRRGVVRVDAAGPEEEGDGPGSADPRTVRWAHRPPPAPTAGVRTPADVEVPDLVERVGVE